MTPFRAEIVVSSGKYSLDPDLVQALIEQESSGDPFAWNPEPRYRYLWNVKKGQPFRVISEAEATGKWPPADFPGPISTDPDQEFWAQQASWGLMQMLGAVAREEGFLGPYLTQLCDPVINLAYGTKHLAALVGWARRQYTGLQAGADVVIRRSALAAWNGGKQGNAPSGILRNGAYADEVLTRYERIRKEAR